MPKFKVSGWETNPKTNRLNTWEMTVTASTEHSARLQAIDSRLANGAILPNVASVEVVK